MRAEDVFSCLTGFQRGLGGHLDWLQNWYQAALNRDAGTPIPDPRAESCAFHRWLEQSSDGPLSEFAGFATLVADHAAVHERATRITALARSGQTINASDYEVLMGAVLAFSTTAQALEREVWATLATVDPLTGLPNRHSMRTQLTSERDRSIRQNQPLILALADIDHFKKINDTFGHTQGDVVLRHVAAALRKTVRPYDGVYRYGGEEFLICLPGATKETGGMVLERIRHSIEHLAITDPSGTPIPVTSTFGMALVTHEVSVDDAIEHADRALYDGKRAGRNRVVAYVADAVTVD